MLQEGGQGQLHFSCSPSGGPSTGSKAGAAQPFITSWEPHGEWFDFSGPLFLPINEKTMRASFPRRSEKHGYEGLLVQMENRLRLELG